MASAEMDLSLPRGIRDVPPADHEAHEKIRGAFYEVARLFNFKLMEPAPLEHLSVLRAKSGSDIDAQIYSFKDKSGRDIGLRFDLTVGMTRYVAARRDLKPPIKLASFGGVWRYDEPQHARYRWFHQWDLEIFGASSAEADAEIIDASQMIFKKLKLNTTVKVGDRKTVEGFIRKRVGVTGEEKVLELMRALDKMSKKSRSDLVKEYVQKGISRDQVEAVLDFAGTKGSLDAVLPELTKQGTSDTESLSELHSSLEARNVRGVEYDMSIVRGIDYYTGIVFEISDRDHADLGALCGGGRYDLLPKIFGRPDLAATGAAGGVDRAALSLTRSEVAETLVYVASIGEEGSKAAARALSLLRNAGIRADAPLSPKAIGKQLQDASDAGASWTIIVGAKEVASGQVALRNMLSRTEERLPLEQALQKIRAEIDASKN
ncbi:MAG: histidine--tRNA ligase [Thaumarchaeota archaeon]|nr:histidine--tRNA ligase [Nitrososphaerota archaeon]